MNYNKKKNKFFQKITLFGGTFDPIHYGHLIPIEILAMQIKLNNIILLPNNIPTYRNKLKTNNQQRLTMLQLAIKNHPLFSIDTREIKNEKYTNTIETLSSFRKEIGWKIPLLFIIGQDSLLSINTWYNWIKILNFCHLIVCPRPGYKKISYNLGLQNWINKHSIYNKKILNIIPNGFIYFADTPLINISSTEIRNYKNNNKYCMNLVPPNVLNYIYQYNLY